MSSYDRDERYFADAAETMVESTRWRWLVGVRYGVHRRILNRNVAFTLMMLGTHMNAEGGRCWPSQALLALESNANRRTIRRHLDQAAADGWIFRVKRTGAGQAWAQYSYQATLPTRVDDALDQYLQGRPEPEEGWDKKPQPLPDESSSVPDSGAVEHPNTEGGDISEKGRDIFDEGGVSPRQKVGTQLGPIRSSSDIQKDIHLERGLLSQPTPGKNPEKKVSIQEIAIRKHLSRGMTPEEVYKAAAGAIPLPLINEIAAEAAKETP